MASVEIHPWLDTAAGTGGLLSRRHRAGQQRHLELAMSGADPEQHE